MCLVLEMFPECFYLRMRPLIFVLTEYFVYFLLGDICQQFTREIFDMYQNYSYYKHWEFELLNYTPADYGKHKLKTLSIRSAKTYFTCNAGTKGVHYHIWYFMTTLVFL